MVEQFPYIDAGDERISYQKTGKGPALFCLHGWAGYERTYDRILPWFNPHFTTYQFAWPGYGSQQLRGKRYTVDDMVRWVEEARGKLGHERVNLMGNCIGANIALEYAYRHPGRLDNLILNEPHAFMPPYFYLLLYPVVKGLMLRLLFKTGPGISLLMKMFPLEGEEGTGYTKKRLLHVPTPAMSAYLTAMYLYARSTDLHARPKVKVPTLFPLPEHTFGQVAAFESRYTDCFPNLRMVPVKGPVHNPVVEDPRAFSEAVLPYLVP